MPWNNLICEGDTAETVFLFESGRKESYVRHSQKGIADKRGISG